MLKDNHKRELVERAGLDRHFSAENWAEYNRKFFDALAPKYDYLNEVITLGMHTKYKNSVVDHIPVSDGDLILDICTGSGDMALLLAKRFLNCYIVGADVSLEMLKVARKRSENYPNIEFRYADAMRLPFSDRHFDACVMGYGLRNLTDFRHGIREMIRVTRPGGVIAVLDLGKPQGLLGKTVYKSYFETLMPFLGKHVFHRQECNSFKYLPESNRFFPDPKTLTAFMQESGMEKIKSYSYMMGIISLQVGYVK
ncbi:MAG: ubiquinone/menaquinone biosynthesis methyltransferase [Candidatus Omnitrophica bacterium]|nr:ubiquinone/menaquinone biosynthesis methyltransferase [Candidatus Omnitrophota bacterium]